MDGILVLTKHENRDGDTSSGWHVYDTYDDAQFAVRQFLANSTRSGNKLTEYLVMKCEPLAYRG